MLEYKFFALVNKVRLQDQEVLAQANNTLQITAFDQGLTGKKNRKKHFFEKNVFFQEVYTSQKIRHFTLILTFFSNVRSQSVKSEDFTHPWGS